MSAPRAAVSHRITSRDAGRGRGISGKRQLNSTFSSVAALSTASETDGYAAETTFRMAGLYPAQLLAEAISKIGERLR